MAFSGGEVVAQNLWALEEIQITRKSLTRMMLPYKFGLDEVKTKIDILRQEFQYIHEYNPIESVKWRLKTLESIIKKTQRKGSELSQHKIREHIRDIAGIRITCSFVSDIYRVAAMLMQQPDVKVADYKDYIQTPKPNGYKSLHMILQIPVFMSDRTEKVYVEVQIRTIAMDFWASLEHKIYYKHHGSGDVPLALREGLKQAAGAVAQLDAKMEQIHKEMQDPKLRGKNNDN